MITITFRARPRWWDRERVQVYLKLIDDVAWFRQLGYSIEPPHYGKWGDRKETGFNVVFKNKREKKAFDQLGFVQLIIEKLQEVCGERFIIKVEKYSTKRLSKQGTGLVS
jgi:hypothetical protein